ncbi:hypothetical protein [Komagataeibacter sp. FNDCF1]|uniref:hypothetical protein n=1 Tax=Komagataeibacter sp. FNDCF1 TaxID=2878681 RepID=UPI001E2C5B10|nr:hypothetical protein [Komagataeibacter sp. FNDCF1]MCE2563302.1 hypothetical protein [Komagataeibacter sp. FNDCF1]
MNRDAVSVPGRVSVIRDIVSRMRQYGISSLEYRDNTDLLHISLEKPHEPTVSAISPAPLAQTGVIRSPDMGIFRAVHPLRQGRPVQMHDEIVEKQIVGYVEAGEVLLAIPAGCHGRITDIMARDNQPVGYHQDIFLVT